MLVGVFLWFDLVCCDFVYVACCYCRLVVVAIVLLWVLVSGGFIVVGVLALALFACGVIVSDMPLDCVAACGVVFYADGCGA